MLRHLDIGVTEHLGHVLDAHTISETHRGRIRVPGRMESEWLSKEKQAGEDKT